MALIPPDTIPGLLVRDLPRSLVLGVEEALEAAALRAYTVAKDMDEGHMPHAVGQMRHFHMSEAFHRALSIGDALPTPIKGNGVVTGRAGIFTVGRFNIPEGLWVNGRRSRTRRQMSLANKSIEPLVQSGLFGGYVQATDAVAFFVACFSGSLRVHPEGPVSIQIAVPNPHMTGWLFREPLTKYLSRYDTVENAAPEDRAVPKLKKNIGTRKDGTSEQ